MNGHFAQFEAEQQCPGHGVLDLDPLGPDPPGTQAMFLQQGVEVVAIEQR